MSEQRSITFKASFRNELLAIDARHARDIDAKIVQLAVEPEHAPPLKKRLRQADGLYRLRYKHYRIFYTFNDAHVNVLALRKRATAYDTDLPEPQNLDGPEEDELDFALLTGVRVAGERDPSRWLEAAPESAAQGKTTKLPEPITSALLRALRVDAKFHAALTACGTEEDLLDCESVPEAVRMQLVDALVGRPFEEVIEQPDFVLQQPEDLLKYKQGELLGFLLKLNPEQERFVSWAANASGPTLLKGGPGTGKSTVALYRTRVMIDALRKQGVKEPRLLFTTYTRALTRFSEQLLAQLLGEDARCVEVCTADSLAARLYERRFGSRPTILQAAELDQAFDKAVGETRFEGNSLVQAAQRQTLTKLGRDYLRDEVLGVIQARGLGAVDEYLAAARPGRKVPLNQTQRQAVWRLHEAFTRLIERTSQVPWPLLRSRAATAARDGNERYDAVLVDEAQDLDPAALGMLVSLCSSPNRVFLTADANQSIYGGAFRWKDVHNDLSFTGRTGVLRANHRSTREISEAAHSYLDAGGALDQEAPEREYVHSGPLPAARTVGTSRDEVELVVRFFKGATRDLRLGMGACAVLCPTNASAKGLAEALSASGLKAAFMGPSELDLAAPGVKTMTLKSAKGLEFPIVAVAGFSGVRYPMFPAESSEEARDEVLTQERRTMFVAMTRAMRALLVVTPDNGNVELFGGFDSARWNLGADK
jgi:mRNA-degrading endonuclease RelE of RelBE toxin-antitoxin system